VQEAIAEKVLKPELNKQAKPHVGRVSQSYYKTVKYKSSGDDNKVDKFNLPVVDVEIIDKRSNDIRELKGVPVLHSALSSNVDGRKVQRGDRVMVLFYRDNDAHPFVIGRLYGDDDELEEEMRADKGATKSNANGHF